MKGKKIVVGITGGIAAYKAPLLVRLLKKEGAEVRTVCTPAALNFVTELTLRTLSGYPVYTDTFASENVFSTAHVAYAEWADFFVTAPATANTIAKYAGGMADNALTALFSAYAGRHIDKVLIVPAMNGGMYLNPATQANLRRLKEWGAHIMEPERGFLACGSEDIGRMPEPEQILREIRRLVYRPENVPENPFKGKHALVTAGATIEDFDPVRYITNRSTGLMGCCLSDELARRGACVHLIHGEDMRHTPEIPPFETVAVRGAQEMYEACVQRWPQMDVAILAAAVADYTPRNVSGSKIKKQDGPLCPELVRTRDILKTLGETKRPDQILTGFALETDREIENAEHKLRSKNADFIVLNSLRTEGAGFGGSTNHVRILDKKGGIHPYPLASKAETAAYILDCITE